MTTTINYYFSVMSPWSYLGDERLRAIASHGEAAIVHKPVDTTVIFSRTGGLALKDRSKERQAYRMRELKRWSTRLDLPINYNPRHYPVDSTPSARVIIAAKQHGLNVGLLTCALMRAVWVDEANVSEPAVLHSLLEAQALPADDLLERAGSDDVSDEYAANTEEAITQGVFGVPAYALCDDLLWGQDRLDFVEALLAKARAPG